MKVQRTLIAVVIYLVVIGFGGAVSAGDWEKAPIDDLDGLLNARTDLKKPTEMELGRSGRTAGHPEAYADLDVECIGQPKSEDSHCNIQLEFIFSRPKNAKERVKIQILDGEEHPLNTVYLLRPTSDDVRSRVYVVGAKFTDGLKPTVRVAIRSDKDSIRGNARVTFLKAKVEKEDKTNWQVASNWSLVDRNGLALNRPTFLFLE